MKKIYCLLAICMIVFMILFILFSKNTNSVDLVNEKIFSEMEYVENIIFKIVKKYMSNDYLVGDGLDWGIIKEDFNVLNNASNVICQDFRLKNFEEEDILKFKENLDNVNLRINEKNDIVFLRTLADLFALILNYESKYFIKTSETIVRNIKKLNLYAMIMVLEGDFKGGADILNLSENEYVVLTQNQEYLMENNFYVNRIYEVLKDFKTELEKEDINLAKIKYLNTLGV